MKKRILMGIILASFCFSVMAYAAPPPKYILKLGHVSASTYPYHLASERVAKEVLEKTKGEVDIKIFPSSQLGSSRDLAEGVQLGSVDIALVNTAVLAQFAPRIIILDLPFLFRDYEHVHKVLDGPLVPEIFSGVEKVALHLCTWDNGFRHFMTSKRSLTKPEDMKGLKMRVMESKMYIDMARLLGANPTPISFGELFTALEQKTVDGADSPIASINAERFYEVQKYLTISGHTYNGSVVIMSNKTVSKLPPEYVKIIKDAFNANTEWQRNNVGEQEKAALVNLKQKGMIINTWTNDQKKQFSNLMAPLWEKMAPTLGKDLINKIANTQ
jgi:tripartite ATP-independent transporter DctP family solute receptor